jgi:hypothetical protein
MLPAEALSIAASYRLDRARLLPARSIAGPLMRLGNMRAFGVRGHVLCLNCRHEATLSVNDYPDDVEEPSFGARMVEIGTPALAPRYRETQLVVMFDEGLPQDS